MKTVLYIIHLAAVLKEDNICKCLWHLFGCKHNGRSCFAWFGLSIATVDSCSDLTMTVTEPLYFHSIISPNFPSVLQADTEKARSSSSSRTSSRHRRVCIFPAHFLFVCLHFLSFFSYNPALNLSSLMSLFVCLSALTPHFQISRG